MLKNHLIDDVVCEIPVCEYQERLARTQERMKEENFDALIIYSNPWHMSNVFWLSNFRAFDGISPDPALLIVPLEEVQPERLGHPRRHSRRIEPAPTPHIPKSVRSGKAWDKNGG